MEKYTNKNNMIYKKLVGNRKKIILVKGEPKEKNVLDFSHLPPPPDQVQLKPDDLKEEIARILTIIKHPENYETVVYSYKEKKWVEIPYVNQSHIYLNFVGNYYFKDSEDARIYSLNKKEYDEKKRFFYDPRIVDDYVDENNEKKFRVLKNKFNFIDRTVQTKSKSYKEVECQTDPAQNVNFSDGITQFSLFNIYEEDFKSKASLKQRKNTAKPVKNIPLKLSDSKQKSQQAIAQEQKAQEMIRMNKSAKVIERMINQNSFNEIILDYKFWDDNADSFRKEGSLLPLWKFPNSLTKRKCITAISWSKNYNDLFAVATGSYNFFKKTTGSIIGFSLKNPSFHEFRIETTTSCMTIDFNPRIPNLLAAGFYDGSVCIYDLKLISIPNALYCFKSETKHYDPVWQVQWQMPNVEDLENFNSVSADCKIINWELKKNHLFATELTQLNIQENDPNSKVEGSHKIIAHAGTCMDFNTQNEDLFLVGTEDGKVLEYSSLHRDKLLTIFDAHSQPIYSIKWNTFYKRVFITCSADFSVKIWDHRYKNPLLTYELSAPVSDVQWAPYSSTVFAALTLDGNIHIFDIYLDLEKPLCVQNVLLKKKRRLTHVCFSPFFPILVIGDEKGTLTSFKLSPNLRSIQKDTTINAISILNKEKFEQDKIRNILLQEAELNPELVETNRKAYKFEIAKPKKKAEAVQDDDEQEEKKTDKNIRGNRK
ncbi:unnamed protein product [Brachionus calyciflorus]|uniref:Dynein intermediate chain n=1 Tax=Brachionus calyciflorus TaxID=104777 RepID=A0A813M3L2_9BILA|nr:unnamed protein product [Brachionus calyciflorus]